MAAYLIKDFVAQPVAQLAPPQLAPAPQLPAVVPQPVDPAERIAHVDLLVQQASKSFDSTFSRTALPRSASGWLARHEVPLAVASVAGLAAAALGYLTSTFIEPSSLAASAVVLGMGVFVAVGLTNDPIADAKDHRRQRKVDSTELAPLRGLIARAAGEHRVAMSALIARRAEVLRAQERLTNKAAIDLREAAGATDGKDPALQRAADVASFAAVSATTGVTAVETLVRTLHEAPVEERRALGDYLANKLFPKPLSVAEAKDRAEQPLFQIVAMARRGEDPSDRGPSIKADTGSPK